MIFFTGIILIIVSFAIHIMRMAKYKDINEVVKQTDKANIFANFLFFIGVLTTLAGIFVFIFKLIF